ncbi:MAG: DUF1304 domain-containing protein [Pseudomonadota bacterium]
MDTFTQIFALLAALLHVLIFCMESLWFMKPGVYKRFGARTMEDAQARRLFAFNQGFYNLFLALGIFFGFTLIHTGSNVVVAQTLILFCCASMICAGVVLLFSGGTRMLLAAVIQATFPSLAWIGWFFL